MLQAVRAASRESHRIPPLLKTTTISFFRSRGTSQRKIAAAFSALVAARRNPILRTFYLRLRAAGKPPKLALTATMRKLLIVLNSTNPAYA
jgi:transposase